MADITGTAVRKEIDKIVMGDTWFNAENYGISPDNTPEANAIALNSLNELVKFSASNANIVFPRSAKYLFDGPFQDPNKSNCIIKWPSIPITDKYLNIKYIGSSTPTFSPSAYSTVPLPAATILSTPKNVGSGTRPSFFGGYGPAGGPNFECSYVTVGFEDLLVQVPANPKITAVNFDGFTNRYTKNVGVIAGNSYGTIESVEPTTSSSFGIIDPDYSHGTSQISEGILFVLGFYNGYRVGENADGDDVQVWACRNGCVYDFSHGVSMMKKLSFGWVKNHLTFNAAHAVQIKLMNVERWELGYANLPSRWYNWVADIVDPSNYAEGEIVYVTGRASVGRVKGLFTKPVGSKLYIRDLGNATAT